MKNGKLRFVDDVSPYEGYLWHYGAMPQVRMSHEHKLLDGYESLTANFKQIDVGGSQSRQPGHQDQGD